jgi:hypothetical protein
MHISFKSYEHGATKSFALEELSRRKAVAKELAMQEAANQVAEDAARLTLRRKLCSGTSGNKTTVVLDSDYSVFCLAGAQTIAPPLYPKPPAAISPNRRPPVAVPSLR